MARMIGKLSPAKVNREKRPGMYGDGAGLWLHVGETGGKSWIFRFMLDGKAREMGLGPLHTIGLAEARERARAARQQVLDGIDPIAKREAERAARRLEAAKAITFRTCAEKYIAAKRAGWKNKKHAQQWENTLATYVYPTVGNLAVASIDTGLVMKILEPIWTVKPETAGRVRGRIESVLDYAGTHRWRQQGENPARWKGHLENLLAKRSEVRKVRHHPALPYDEMASFVSALREHDGVAAEALEFLILTTTRSNEVILARPEEIKGKVWIIPEGRMKGEREHRVPLSERAIEIIEKRKQESEGGYLFPGAKRGKPLSNMAMLQLVRGMARDDGKPWTDAQGETVVPHGFRSTFRDWISERTSFPPEMAEMALAHAIDDKTEAAYRRGDMFEKRRKMMQAWAAFCAGRSSVTALPAREGVA